MRKIRPLPGQVLIEILDPPTKSSGGVDLPDERPLSPEFVQSTHINPDKPAKNHIGLVKAIGEWPALPNGMRLMPEYGVGAKVVFNPFRGTELHWGTSRRLRMVRQTDVMAVLT